MPLLTPGLLTPGPWVLAQRAFPTQVLLWAGVLIVLAVLGGAVMLYLRRRLLAKTSSLEGTGTLLDQLRAMRDRGEITSEEFEATTRSIKSRLAAGLDRSTPDPGGASTGNGGSRRAGMRRER